MERLNSFGGVGNDHIDLLCDQQITLHSQQARIDERHIAGQHGHQWLMGSRHGRVQAAQRAPTWEWIGRHRQTQKREILGVVGGDQKLLSQRAQARDHPRNQRLSRKQLEGFVLTHPARFAAGVDRDG